MLNREKIIHAAGLNSYNPSRRTSELQSPSGHLNLHQDILILNDHYSHGDSTSIDDENFVSYNGKYSHCKVK